MQSFPVVPIGANAWASVLVSLTLQVSAKTWLTITQVPTFWTLESSSWLPIWDFLSFLLLLINQTMPQFSHLPEHSPLASQNTSLWPTIYLSGLLPVASWLGLSHSPLVSWPQLSTFWWCWHRLHPSSAPDSLWSQVVADTKARPGWYSINSSSSHQTIRHFLQPWGSPQLSFHQFQLHHASDKEQSKESTCITTNLGLLGPSMLCDDDYEWSVNTFSYFQKLLLCHAEWNIFYFLDLVTRYVYFLIKPSMLGPHTGPMTN